MSGTDYIAGPGAPAPANRLSRRPPQVRADGEYVHQGLNIDIRPGWSCVLYFLSKRTLLTATGISRWLHVSHPASIGTDVGITVKVPDIDAGQIFDGPQDHGTAWEMRVTNEKA